MLFLRSLSALLLSLALLWVWRRTAVLSCASLLVASIVVLAIAAGLREQAVRRRRCSARCWFRPGSIPYRWLHGQVLVTLRSLAVGLFAASVLLLGLLAWEPEMLALLALDALLMLGLFALFRALAGRMFHPEAGAVLVKTWTVAINTWTMAAAFMVLQLYSPVPEYIEPSVSATIESASRQIASQCPVVDLLAEAYVEKEAFAWWLMVQGGERFEAPGLRWAAWTIFLLSGTIGLWAYSRFLAQLLGFASVLEYREEAGMK
jgi:hypothetical protein